MFKNKLEFKGAIIGMVLGDATIVKRESGSCHLQFAHKKADEEYVQYKVKILNWLNETKMGTGISRLNQKEYPYVSGRTLTHPFYASLHEHFYFQKRKTVNEHIMKCITPLGLALWYCDDGTLAGEVGYRCPFLCTHNFNQTENELLSRMIFKKFGITFRVIKKNVKEKTYFWLRLKREDRDKFFEIIKQYVPECMKRKIDISYYTSDTQYSDLSINKICIDCGADFLEKKRSIRKCCSDNCLANVKRKTRILNKKASSQKIVGRDSPTLLVIRGGDRNDHP